VRAPYRWLTRLARRLLPAFGPAGSKLRAGLEGRARAHETLAEWGREHRDRDRPLLWFHAPSVGESLQAQAVIEALRARRPDVQVAYTHFSPSAQSLAGRIGADVSAYLPWDLPGPVEATLDGLAPTCLVFTKTEVWPELVARARPRGIAVALVAASVPPGAGRSRWPARALLRSTWASLDLAAACGAADARGLERLGVDPTVVRVTGDPGIDSAAARADAADPGAPHLAPFYRDRAPTVVAGSTWPADEAELLPALRGLRGRVPALRCVIAPHEPTGEHVAALGGALRRDGWSPARLSDVIESGTVAGHDAVVVDSVGLLAQLYTVGDVAYVGGGFHDRGLHSVLEPAAAGRPIVFGPKHANARAAAELVEAGGAKIASDRGTLERILAGWLAGDGEGEAAGSHAFGYIDDHRGAADRTAALLQALLPQRFS